MKKIILMMVALMMAPIFAHSAEFKEGVHYKVLNDGPGTTKPEITEFFSFFCGHCYNFSKAVVPQIKRTLPDGVKFRQEHVEFIGNTGKEMSRAFAIAEQLNVADTVDKALFKAIHEDNKTFNNMDDIKKIFIANGVTSKEFDAVANSFLVNSQVDKMRRDVENSGIEGVPSLVVDGKYLVLTDHIKSYQEMLDIAYYLAQKDNKKQ